MAHRLRSTVDLVTYELSLHVVSKENKRRRRRHSRYCFAEVSYGDKWSRPRFLVPRCARTYERVQSRTVEWSKSNWQLRGGRNPIYHLTEGNGVISPREITWDAHYTPRKDYARQKFPSPPPPSYFRIRKTRAPVTRFAMQTAWFAKKKKSFDFSRSSIVINDQIISLKENRYHRAIEKWSVETERATGGKQAAYKASRCLYRAPLIFQRSKCKPCAF